MLALIFQNSRYSILLKQKDSQSFPFSIHSSLGQTKILYLQLENYFFVFFCFENNHEYFSWKLLKE